MKTMKKFLLLIIACMGLTLVAAQPAHQDIEKNVPKPLPVELNPSMSDSLFNTGSQIIIEMGTSLGLDMYGGSNKINFIYGSRLTKHLFVGFGTGLRCNTSLRDYFYYNGQPTPVFNDFGVPVFLDFRINFHSKKFIPFILIDYGYSFDLEDNDPTSRGEKYSMNNIRPVGFLFCPGAGVSVIYSEKYMLNISINLETQLHKDYLGWTHNNPSVKMSSSHGINLNLGLSF
jgi:hypothetical protein